jgi:hypothetical protein
VPSLRNRVTGASSFGDHGHINNNNGMNGMSGGAGGVNIHSTPSSPQDMSRLPSRPSAPSPATQVAVSNEHVPQTMVIRPFTSSAAYRAWSSAYKIVRPPPKPSSRQQHRRHHHQHQHQHVNPKHVTITATSSRDDTHEPLRHHDSHDSSNDDGHLNDHYDDHEEHEYDGKDVQQQQQQQQQPHRHHHRGSSSISQYDLDPYASRRPLSSFDQTHQSTIDGAYVMAARSSSSLSANGRHGGVNGQRRRPQSAYIPRTSLSSSHVSTLERQRDRPQTAFAFSSSPSPRLSPSPRPNSRTHHEVSAITSNGYYNNDTHLLNGHTGTVNNSGSGSSNSNNNVNLGATAPVGGAAGASSARPATTRPLSASSMDRLNHLLQPSSTVISSVPHIPSRPFSAMSVRASRPKDSVRILHPNRSSQHAPGLMSALSVNFDINPTTWQLPHEVIAIISLYHIMGMLICYAYVYDIVE